MLKFFFLIVSVSYAHSALAQQTYNVLEPITGLTEATFTATNFSQFLNSAFNFGIGIAALLAVIVLVIGGIEYMGSEGPFSKNKAKERIQNAIFGLILALGIVLFLNTINPDLIKLNLDFGESRLTPVTSGGREEDQEQIPLEDMDPQERLARERLQATGISVNKNPCPAGTRYQDVPGGCTSVGGLTGNTLNKLIAFKEACGGCRVVVTGGSELGHATHGDGKKVDLRKYTDTDMEISRIGSPINDSSVCSVGNPRFGITLLGETSIFINETIAGNDPHWHVCF